MRTDHVPVPFIALSAAAGWLCVATACKGSSGSHDKAAAAESATRNPTSAGPQAPPPASYPKNQIQLKEGAKNVGILIFDDLFITEFVAPFDVYHHVKDKMNVFLVGQTMDPITTYEGIVLQPHYSFENVPRIDVLVVPSGNKSMTDDLKKEEYISFVQKTSSEAEYVTSHCWGAFTLAEAGVLDGKEATTFPTSLDAFAKSYSNVKVTSDRRYVEAGNIITSNGGVAAFEAALAVVEKLFGKEEADRVAAGLVFAPQNVALARNPGLARSAQ